MNFRDFLQLFNSCDHSWGQLARYAGGFKTWKGNNAVSLSILLESGEARIACHEVNIVYSIYQKPIGLNMDLRGELSQGGNPIKLVISDR